MLKVCVQLNKSSGGIYDCAYYVIALSREKYFLRRAEHSIKEIDRAR